MRYGSYPVLRNMSFSVEEGQWLMLIGPNGAGKSTALGAIAQTVPYTGEIYFQNEPLRTMKPRQRARCLGMLGQRHSVGYRFTVEELVELGRYAHPPVGSRDAVAEALELTGLTALRQQSVLTLSGGELQRAFLAQVLAQQPRMLLLDEPTNHLDLVYQQQLFTLVSQWLRQPGRGVISVVHDLSLARRFGTHALLLDKGRTAATGTVSQVFCPQYLNAVYQMDVPAWMHSMLSQWEDMP